MPRLSRILETCLYATDLAASADFYADVLGLPLVSRVQGRHAFFRAGEAMFLLFRPEATESSTEVPPHGARGSGHVAFAVQAGELPRWRRHFHEHGIPIEREVEWPRGGKSLYVRDPAGNSVELATPEIWGAPSPPGATAPASPPSP